MSTALADSLIIDLYKVDMDPKNEMNLLISREQIMDLIRGIKPVLEAESLLLELDSPIHVVGDLHGNFRDLLRIFQRCGHPPDAKYLFLGDYVDRGSQSLELITFLFAMKLKFPTSIYLLRGNHETQTVNANYGFKSQVIDHYSAPVFYAFNMAFSYLSYAAIINKKIFCVHGGIGKEFTNLDMLRKMHKPIIDTETTRTFLTDFIWSDPASDGDLWYTRSTRGLGWKFGASATRQFLERLGLEMVLRSHEHCGKGHDWAYDDTSKLCLTVFSSSNYCGLSNEAGICYVDINSKIDIINLPPLTDNALENYRIEIPQWVIEKIGSYPVDVDDLINEVYYPDPFVIFEPCGYEV